MSALSSHPRPGLYTDDAHRAAARAAAYRAQARRLRRLIIRIERRPIGSRPGAVLPRVRQPADAEQVLQQLATRFKVGEPVGERQIVEATGVRPGRAHAVRTWARSVGRWPYLDAASGFAAARAAKGGGT